LSEFIKTQQELRANLYEQMKDVIESAEAESRGLDAAEMEKISRIEADMDRAAEAISVAQRAEERKLEVAEAAKGFVPAEEKRDDAAIFRAMASGEVRSHTFNHEKRALVPATATVPVGFLDQVYGLARLVGPMLDVSDVITRTSGEKLAHPHIHCLLNCNPVRSRFRNRRVQPNFRQRSTFAKEDWFHRSDCKRASQRRRIRHRVRNRRAGW